MADNILKLWRPYCGGGTGPEQYRVYKEELQKYMSEATLGEVLYVDKAYSLCGYVYGRPGFNDGDYICTSRIEFFECIEAKPAWRILAAHTKSGSVYAVHTAEMDRDNS